MITLKLDEKIADEIFEVLQELINRARHNHDDVVLSYCIPLLKSYGEALIRAKPQMKRSAYTLPKLKKGPH